MGQASPYEMIPSQNKIDVFMNTKNYSHEGFPMNLTFTDTNYSYSKYNCDRPAALADSMVDEDKGCSLFDGTTFGSIRGRAALAFDLVSTPSVGWKTSS